MDLLEFHMNSRLLSSGWWFGSPCEEARVTFLIVVALFYPRTTSCLAQSKNLALTVLFFTLRFVS